MRRLSNMNVQFSLSANTIPQTSTITTEVVSNDRMGLEVQNIRSAKELTSKEMQGVKLSVGEGQLIRNIERAVKALQGPETTLNVSIHEKTHEIMVKVLNRETGELIREIPSEKTLDLVAKMMEIAGIMIDERV
jgi:flagellar protein FlaG